MAFCESIKATGHYNFEAYDENGRRPDLDREFHNVVVQGFFTKVFEFMNQAISNPTVESLNLTHFATGTGTATPMKSDTALGAEYFRKGISVKSFGLTSFSCKTVIGPTESNITIKEVGIFANGTSTPSSGMLVSRCAVNIEKTSNLQYIATYTMTIQ